MGLLLIVFIVAKGRRFDGENTWFYFLWYGIGRFWVEGLRTDSLYLFNWTIGGEPIRVSQALSLVMVLVSAFMLLYNIKLHPPQAGGAVCEYRRGAEGGRGRKRGRQRGVTRCGFGAVYRSIAEHHMQPAFGTGGAVKEHPRLKPWVFCLHQCRRAVR